MILRIKAVVKRVGISRATIYRKMDDGTFPKSVPLSKRARGWPEEDIDLWERSLKNHQQSA